MIIVTYYRSKHSSNHRCSPLPPPNSQTGWLIPTRTSTAAPVPDPPPNPKTCPWNRIPDLLYKAPVEKEGQVRDRIGRVSCSDLHWRPRTRIDIPVRRSEEEMPGHGANQLGAMNLHQTNYPAYSPSDKVKLCGFSLTGVEDDHRHIYLRT